MALIDHDFRAEVSSLFADLRTESVNKRLEALAGLHRVGVWSRGSILPRGTWTWGAAAPWGDIPIEAQLHPCLRPEEPPEIRRKAALAAGYLGGHETVGPLIEALERDRDPESAIYYMSALKTIGGRRAAVALVKHLQDRDPKLQDAALSGIFDLATGGSLSDIESVIGSPSGTRVPAEADDGGSDPLREWLVRLRDLPGKLTIQLRAAEMISYFTRAGWPERVNLSWAFLGRVEKKNIWTWFNALVDQMAPVLTVDALRGPPPSEIQLDPPSSRVTLNDGTVVSVDFVGGKVVISFPGRPFDSPPPPLRLLPADSNGAVAITAHWSHLAQRYFANPDVPPDTEFEIVAENA